MFHPRNTRFLLSRALIRILIISAAVVVAGSCGRNEPTPAPAPVVGAHATVEDFLKSHWGRPAGGSGIRAAGAGLVIASLDVAACAECHQAQFEDWRHSLHSRAMGPGVAGQLVTMVATDPVGGESCMRCHAPLAEQTRSLAASASGQRGTASATNQSAADRLHLHGLMCSGCHVRDGRVFGPPRRDGSSPDPNAVEPSIHRWSASTAYQDSRFCAPCHQFDPEDYALNGKLLENTFEEWRSSRYAREGVGCQNCHMPDRRHLWRGIHDPEMVRRALTIDVAAEPSEGAELVARMRIRNTGAGHFFPTYVTPRVYAQAYQEDGQGRELRATRRQLLIARDVKMDLSEEIADTRIAPEGHADFDYRVPRHPTAAALVFRMWVEPDAFYREFFRSMLDNNEAGAGKAQIERAFRDASTSGFVAYSERVVLPAVRAVRTGIPASGR